MRTRTIRIVTRDRMSPPQETSVDTHIVNAPRPERVEG
jgi:hypothetical protein